MDNHKKNLSQQIADNIYNLIYYDNEFKPGEQLPSENILSERLGVSRATLREAIRTLESQGVLRVLRGKGTYVSETITPPDDFGLGEINRKAMRLRDLWEARLLFEPEIAAVACRRATDIEMAEILRMGRAVEKTILSGKDRTRADQSFHRAIASATHNEFMLQMVPIINRALAESVYYYQENVGLPEHTLSDHALLMDFLEKRDSKGAKYAMAIHIRRAIIDMDLEVSTDL